MLTTVSQKIPIQAVALIPRFGCVTASGELADSGTPAHQGHVIGVTEGKIESGDWGDATITGTIYYLGWSWTPGGAIYLATTILSQTPPGIGFVLQVGLALTAQSMVLTL